MATTCGTRWGTRWRPRSRPRTWPWPGCSTGIRGCACCWPTAAVRCRWSAAGCGGPLPSAQRRAPASHRARTRRCAASTTTPSPTTTTCSRTWPDTPGPDSSCLARTARSTWAPIIRWMRSVRSGLAPARNLCLAATRPACSGSPVADVAPAGHGGALLAGLLAEHGVRHVFGVPGGQTLALYDAILDRQPALGGVAGSEATLRHVLVRDERSAAYAADAYARVTGRAGVCDATVGPGAAKLPSGLGEALGASVPVVALVSELPARFAPHRYRGAASQALDQAALLAPVTKWHAAVPDAATLPALVRQAFREATTGRPGPVALFLPQDVLDGPAPDYVARPPARFGSFPAFRPAPDPDDVAAAGAVLRAAQRPFVLAGGGVLHSGAGAELTALAEALSAAVGTTLSGKGAIAEDHPLSVGVTGSMGTGAAAAALAEADVVLLAGTKAGSGATFGWSLPRADQAVVQLDLDPAELGRAFPHAVAVLADARPGLAALRTALSGSARPDRAAWRARVAELAAAWRADRDAERASDAVPIAPQRVLAEIEAAVGRDDMLICDASLASGWGGVYLEQRHAGRRV